MRKFSGNKMFLFSLLVSHCSGQLIGNRGVFLLPEGQQYRDAETLEASERVSAFARRVQPELDLEAELNMLGEQDRSFSRQKRKLLPVFLSANLPNYVRKVEADLFYYSQTKAIDPPIENKQRIFQDWLERSKQSNNEPVEMKKPVLKNLTRISSYRNFDGFVSTRQLIADSGNLWQHLARERNTEEDLADEQLPQYLDTDCWPNHNIWM